MRRSIWKVDSIRQLGYRQLRNVQKRLSRNMLMVHRTFRPKSTHCRSAEKPKQNQSTDRAAIGGFLSGPTGQLARPDSLELASSVVTISVL